MHVPFGESRFFSTRALISLLLLLFLFTALGSSFSSPAPLALSFLRAAILAADRLRELGAGAGGGLFSKKRISSPSEKPLPRVGMWGAAGLWVVLGTSEPALGDNRLSRPSEDDNDPEGLVPTEFCSTLFWISSALLRRLSRSSRCFCFCCFSRSEAEMDWTGAPAAALETDDVQQVYERTKLKKNVHTRLQICFCFIVKWLWGKKVEMKVWFLWTLWFMVLNSQPLK